MGLPVEVNNLLLGGARAYTIGRSLRFRNSASANLSRTPASAGNRKTWTWSGWIKRGQLGVQQHVFNAWDGSNNSTGFYFATNDTIEVFSILISPTTYYLQLDTTQVFRDASAWYHFVIAIDTTQATASNRAKLYVNGTQVTALSTASYPSQNSDLFVNTNSNHYLSRASWYSGNYFDGYLAEVNFIDGQALTPSSFGETDLNGIWQPKKYAGTYGTNGFYLPFSDTTSTTTLVQDSSGNGNNWTANNISLTAGTTYDSMIDSPTVSASSSNYCVLNPLDKNTNIALSDGNLTAIPSSTADYWLCRATMQLPSTGKWYWELTLNNTPYLYQAGVYSANRPNSGATSSTGNEYQVAWGTAYTYIQYQSNNAAFAAWGTNTNPTSGNVLMFAVDSDNGTMWVGRNGTWYNTSGTANPATNTDPRFSSIPSGLFAGVNLPNPASGGVSMNFGQRPFSYTPPTGFNALNTYNLPAVSITNGAKNFAATTYTGTGATQSISNAVNGFSFQPDLVWGKQRNGASSNVLTDSVRGTNSQLSSNLTNAQDTQTDVVTAFNSNGFTVGASAGFNMNQSGSTLVAWQWKGGGTAVTNNSGTISSQVSANASAGFSIVTYTGNGTAGATVGHSLGVAPELVIWKKRSAVANWFVWSKAADVAAGSTRWGYLNATNAFDTSASTNEYPTYKVNPTSSVFTVNGTGSSNGTNDSTATYVAYCFAAVRGYSAFGSYSGNGSSDGVFVYLGFRPRYILHKASSTTSQWMIWDTSRNTYNVLTNAELLANSSAAEGSGAWGVEIDILSNGFKFRGFDNTNFNYTGVTYVYAAFAESPFNISRAR